MRATDAYATNSAAIDMLVTTDAITESAFPRKVARTAPFDRKQQTRTMRRKPATAPLTLRASLNAAAIVVRAAPETE